MNTYLNFFRITLLFVLPVTAILSQAAAAGNQPHNPGSTLNNTKGKIYGKVIETIKAGNYTYIHVDTGKNKYWAASPPTTLKKGAMISFVPNMPMRNFTSKTLKRKFDVVYFVGKIYTDTIGNHQGKANPHQINAKKSMTPVAGIKKANNGNTIQEVFAMKQKLAGKDVFIRGLVVKYTPQVMGKNWVHIRDSSSTKDLTINTTSTVKKGDVILVKGKLQLNRNFGFGYVYDVLLEDASILPE